MYGSKSSIANGVKGQNSASLPIAKEWCPVIVPPQTTGLPIWIGGGAAVLLLVVGAVIVIARRQSKSSGVVTYMTDLSDKTEEAARGDRCRGALAGYWGG